MDLAICLVSLLHATIKLFEWDETPNAVPHLCFIGDANGKMMLAHAASYLAILGLCSGIAGYVGTWVSSVARHFYKRDAADC
ncbi:dihydrolipoyl dehydrogenase [Sarracenia purpurea var. burkii]